MSQWKKHGGGRAMLDSDFVTKLLCVAFVAAIMLPVGHILFPYVSDELSGMQFQAIEAVVSATVGFGIYSVLG
jgi:small basic protein